MQQFKDPGNILKESKERPITIASKNNGNIRNIGQKQQKLENKDYINLEKKEVEDTPVLRVA